MDRNYANAIELLMNGNLDLRQVAIALAKHDPLLFTGLAQESLVPREPKYAITAVTIRDLIFGANKMVDAIKTLRAWKGIGLKEAKDICDALKEHGPIQAPDLMCWVRRYEGQRWAGDYTFSFEQRHILDELINGE